MLLLNPIFIVATGIVIMHKNTEKILQTVLENFVDNFH